MLRSPKDLFYPTAPRSPWTQVSFCWGSIWMSILLLVGISIGEKFKNTANSPESRATWGILDSHHVLCEEYFFPCFKLANTLLENAVRDTQTARLTLLWDFSVGLCFPGFTSMLELISFSLFSAHQPLRHFTVSRTCFAPLCAYT